MSVLILLLLLPVGQVSSPQSLTDTAKPQHFLTGPPPNENGFGAALNLADSVNGYQAHSLTTSDNLSTCQSPYRNVTLTQNPPSGFSVAWQNLSVSTLTAVPDFREVQYASGSTSYLSLVRTGGFSRAAMRFSPPDAVNLTSVWLYYESDEAIPSAQLQVWSKGTNNGTTPQGGSVIATVSPLPSGPAAWRNLTLSNPVFLANGSYYWIVVDASSINPSKYVRWYYINDSGGLFDQKLAAAYTSSWIDEINFPLYSQPYLNLMLVLKVLPVVSGNPSKVMTYSSPGKVKMRELTSGTLMSNNSTGILATTHRFILSTNTSVSFAENWTARFEKYQIGAVQTTYNALPGSTSWEALFSSLAKPSSPYAWYNRTLKVVSIPSGWQIDPLNNVTNDNNINFTASFFNASGYLLITQTDNLIVTGIWDAWWTIDAKSSYHVTLSAPSQVITGQLFNISITPPIASSNCNITLYDGAGSNIFSRSLVVPPFSTYYFPIRLNQTGNFNVTIFDRLASIPEASYTILPTISSLPALTSLDLQSSTLKASWGDIVAVTFRYMNTTLGSNREFPNLPDVTVYSVSDNFTIRNLESLGSGWYSFNFETRLLPTSGSYILTIALSYEGTYLNQETLTLQLDPPGISPILLVLVGGGSGGAVIAVVAARRYFGGRKLKEEKKSKVLLQTASLAQLVVVDLASGRSVYSRSIGTEESVDPNLISGFLSANQSILGEVFRKKARTGLRFADYGEYKVISNVGDHVLSALFATEAAGEELTGVLEKFTQKFERKYSKTLETWDGDPNAFKDADAIADEVFSLPLTSPYVLMEQDFSKRRLSGIEKKVVEEARRISSDRGFFFMPRIIDFLLTKEGVKRSETIDVIRSLVDKGILKQLTVSQAAELSDKGG
ncbi:MAG: hypothetical protein WED05_06695 [Candidatus Atabeyarchaeum deiterrae]